MWCAIICSAILLPDAAIAQSGIQSPNKFRLSPQVAFVWPHNQSVEHIRAHPIGMEAELVWAANGKKAWHKAYNHPAYGLSLLAFHYRHPMLAQSLSLTPFIAPVLWRTQKCRWTMRLGTGLVYSPHPFDLESNPYNNALSSRFSIAMQMNMGLEWKPHPTHEIGLKPTFTHFSNGAFKLPNSGINIPGISLSYAYQWQQDPVRQVLPSDTVLPLYPFVLDLGLGMAVREVEPTGGPKHPIYALRSQLGYQLGRRSLLSGGFTLVYNTSLLERLAPPLAQQRHNALRLAVLLGHELCAGRLSVGSFLGIYLYQPQAAALERPIFQRYSVKYRITSSIFTQISLKTHYGRADFVDLSLGYRFPLKN